MPRNKNNQNDIDLVYNSLEDCIFETHKLCTLEEISKQSGISKSKCRKILNILLAKDQISIAYKRNNRPTVYIPKYMYQEILRTQRKPDWVENYAFTIKMEKIKEIEATRDEISEYEIIERLLYGTNTPLEEAVAKSLEFLGFKTEMPEDKSIHDVEVYHNGTKYIVEIEGTSKQGSKNKVDQLSGWMKKEVDLGNPPEKLIGFFVVNHFRNNDPDERGDPLTKHAKDYLKMYGFKFFTTLFLFDLVKKVMQKSMTKKDAREKIIKGERFD
ncbi:MAG: hypothetical protein ACTSX6_06830 [Candidatus Heimdallarchaeaceae archaeon]